MKLVFFAILAILVAVANSAACTVGANVLENDLDAMVSEFDEEVETLFRHGRFGVLPHLNRFAETFHRSASQVRAGLNHIREQVGQLMPITSRAVGDVRNEATRRGIGRGGTHKQTTISTNSGKVKISSQDKSIAMELCLHEVAYCSIDCAGTFKLDCSVNNAQIYSIRIPVKEHEAKCVAPRVKAGEKREKCFYSACSCDVFEDWFSSVVGPAELTEAFSKTRRQCMTWCKTGVQPATVWNRAQFTKRMKIGKKTYKTIGKAFDRLIA
jgi:hypothetical protein